MLGREVASGAVVDRAQMVVDGGAIKVCGLGATNASEQFGECQSVFLACSTQSARLDRQEAGHTFGDGSHVAAVVENDEPTTAQPRQSPSSPRC